jgi:hypothetical protein
MEFHLLDVAQLPVVIEPRQYTVSDLSSSHWNRLRSSLLQRASRCFDEHSIDRVYVVRASPLWRC